MRSIFHIFLISFIVAASALCDGYISIAKADVQERVLTEEERRELDKTVEYIERENRKRDYTVPHLYFVDARKEFKDSPLKAFNTLRTFSISVPRDALEPNLEYAEAHDWDPIFIKLFRNVITWADKLLAMSGAEVWAQVATESDPGLTYTDKSLPLYIRSIAIEKMHPPALHQYGLELLAKAGDHPSPISAIARLEEAAHRHYEPSINKLIGILKTKKHFAEYRGATYYWFRRGELRGYDMTRWRSWVADNVTPQDRAWAKQYLDRKTYPPGWEYE